jgi:Putative peptidoglycan binding domain
VPKRRNEPRPIYARAAGAGGAIMLGLWHKATRRPMDFAAVSAAAAVSLIIIVNAVFLQSGSRPAPFFANSGPLQVTGNSPPKAAEPSAPAPSATATTAPLPVAARRNDPIADLIGPSPRIAAVQRALTQYGYGQIKPSGVLDDATSTAIETFERGHKLPITGRVSDRLVSDLTNLVGHPLE